MIGMGSRWMSRLESKPSYIERKMEGVVKRDSDSFFKEMGWKFCDFVIGRDIDDGILGMVLTVGNLQFS